MEFGKSLREAREAKGYTVAQIAESTHIMPSVIEGLEKEDFSRIAAPIYGRGFVKLYCEAVGLEAKPFVDEFMEIMNGNRDISIRERPVAEPTPVQDVPPPPPPPPPAAERDLFTQEPETRDPLPAADPLSATEPPPVADPLSAATPRADISRYASPFRSEDTVSPSFPVLPWRLILLATAGLAILAILICGIRALSCATSTEPASGTVTEVTEEATPEPTAQPVATPTAHTQQRTQQQSIPALYID